MRFCLPLLLILALVACVKEPVSLYPDLGVIVMTSDSVNVNFNVADSDTLLPGWSPWGSSEAVKNMTVTLKENGNKDVHVEEISWEFYDSDGDYLESHHETFIPPITVESGKDTTFAVSVTVSEHLADEFDDASDPIDDFSGSGTVVFYADGYDLERGQGINCVPSYTPMSVSK